MVSYAFTRMLRSLPVCIATACAALAVAVMLIWLDGAAVRYRQQLEAVYDSMEIRCTVSDRKGATDKIYIGNTYIDMMTKPNCELFPYVKSPYFKTVMTYQWQGRATIGNLVGINTLLADYSLTPENGVSFTNIDNALESNDFVIWISEQRFNQYGLSVGDSVTLTSVIPNEPERKATADFAIAGYFTGSDENAIYAPWQTVIGLITQAGSDATWLDSLSFAVADNRELADFHEVAAKHFDEVDILSIKEAKSYLALTVYDEHFRSSLISAQKSIRMIGLLAPLLYAISFAVGFLTCFLFTRIRKKEFYLFHCIGVKRKAVLSEVIFEQALMTVAGISIGAALAQRLWQEGFMPITLTAALLIFLAGGALSAIFTVGRGMNHNQEE